jgi:hypothetical protein
MFSAAGLFAVLVFAALSLTTSVAATTNDSAAPAARAADTQPAKPLPFQPDEELIYQADFSKLLLRGIEIAEFRFTVGRGRPPAEQGATNASADGNGAAGTPGPTASHAVASYTNAAGNGASARQPDSLVFKGDVQARGWFRKIFGIDFHYNHEATVAADTLLILRTAKLDEQGKRVRASEAVFDRATNVVTWTERNPNDPAAEPRVVRNVLDGAAHDFISAIYYLRTQPLKVGQSFELAVSDSGHTVRVPVRVTERKNVKSALGRTPALRVEIGLFGAGRLVGDREGEMSLWITDDARRIPVRARLSADIGTIDIKLKKAVTGKP